MDRLKILEQSEICKGLTSEEVGLIGELCEDKVYREGEVIFAEGSRGRELYVLKQGKVRIDFLVKGRDDTATVHRMTPGQVFGEVALVDRGRRSATAVCECDTQVMVVDCDRLYELLDSNHHIGYVLMRNFATVLAGRLRKAGLQLVASILWE